MTASCVWGHHGFKTSSLVMWLELLSQIIFPKKRWGVSFISYMPDWHFLLQLWTQRSDPVLHIELRRWADILLIAPLDANTLGKIASGICDNLLVRERVILFSIQCWDYFLQNVILYWQTCVVRAWDNNSPLLFCPAMNTAMWHHPITAQQISKLTEFGYVEIPCIFKKLVCGDEGQYITKQYIAIAGISLKKSSQHTNI